MNDLDQNDWIAAHIDELEESWNDWACKETDIFADPIDFYEFCYANQGQDFRKAYRDRVRRGVGRRAVA